MPQVAELLLLVAAVLLKNGFPDEALSALLEGLRGSAAFVFSLAACPTPDHAPGAVPCARWRETDFARLIALVRHPRPATGKRRLRVRP